MRYTKHIIASILLIGAFALLPVCAFADPEDPGGEPVPFDGGLTLLLAAGAGYGIKKMKETKTRR